MGMITWQSATSQFAIVLSFSAILWMYSDFPMPVCSEDTTLTFKLQGRYIIIILYSGLKPYYNSQKYYLLVMVYNRSCIVCSLGK